MHLRKHGVGDKAVVRKDDLPAQALVEHGAAVGRAVVIRQGRLPTRLARVVLGEELNAAQVVDAGLRLGKRLLVDIRRIKYGSLLGPSSRRE